MDVLEKLAPLLDNVPTGSLCGGDEIGDTDEVREHAGISRIFCAGVIVINGIICAIDTYQRLSLGNRSTMYL